jgi:hypothetical protein
MITGWRIVTAQSLMAKTRFIDEAWLFIATAAVVIWQSARLTVLWDLSYVLENATRIAMGDVPYRDFPFPYAPLTFVVQAIIIRLSGRVAWHHIAYAAIAGGAASALTYAIVRRIEPRRGVAIALTIPLIVLGIYCIFPHPFYDPDCCLVVLAVVFLLMRNAPFAAGATAVLAVFVKQNIGLALVIAIVILAIAWRQWRVIAGVVTAATCAIGIVAIVFGIHDYVVWTIRYAAERRLMPLREMLSIYVDPTLWWWLGCVIAGVLVSRWGKGREGAEARRRGGDDSLAVAPPRPRAVAPSSFTLRRAVSIAFIVAPFVWSMVRIFISDDPLERQVNLLCVWPLVIVCATITAIIEREVRIYPERSEGSGGNDAVRSRSFALLRMNLRSDPSAIVPLLIVAAVHGAFMSQITWGSTYGIWPLLMILLAFTLRRAPAVIAFVVVAAILAGGIPYVIHNERLTYVKLDGAPYRSHLPALRGLTVAGEWLPDFEELVAWLDHNVPRGDAILFLPGEDPLYFTTGRRPRFPVLMFDRTINPYDPETIARLADERHVRWVIIKQRLQLNGAPMEDLGETVQRVAPGARVAARLHDYVVMERPVPVAVNRTGLRARRPGYDRSAD